MRNRVWIACAALLVLGALLLMFWEKPDSSRAVRERKPGTNATAIEGVQSTQPLRQASMPSTNSFTQSSTSSFPQEVLAVWQVPIEFYGKVIDQDGKPVSGAKVTFELTPEPSLSSLTSKTTPSDSAGLFSLHAQGGPSLDVYVTKEGYYSSHRGHWSFRAAELPVTSRYPLLFPMRKKAQGVQLVTSGSSLGSELEVRLPTNNAPVTVDLLQKQVHPQGQLELRQIKPPWREATEWSFSMSIPDGGFVPNQEEFQFEAPESGYQPIVDYLFVKGEANWTTLILEQYYIAFGQPRRYGWLHIRSDLSQQTVFLTYAINPSGSRNLEPLREQEAFVTSPR